MAKKPEIKNLIAIAAGKGGVGKSTVSVNLARSLRKLGYSVGVMDVDIYGPSVAKLLPADTPPKQEGQKMIPAVCEGIKIISMAYFREEKEASAVRAPIANGIVAEFIDRVAWGDLDYLLIDFPPGTGDVQLTVSQKAKLTGACMVTTPQELALLDVRKAVNLFDQVHVPIIGVIENMSYFSSGEGKVYPFGRGGGARLAKEIGANLLGEIPLDPEVCESGDLGRSIFERDSEAAREFYRVAEAFVAQVEKARVDNALSIQKIWKKNEHTVCIEWSDKETSELRLSDLQKRCPCAHCVDENTGVRIGQPVDETVGVTTIDSVGRYALRFTFTSGCSTGIYDFDLLRGLTCSL